MMTFQDSAKLTLFSMFLMSCPSNISEKEEFQEREIIAWVCHHPGSVWHLSECNEQCTERNYDGEAYCLALREPMCEVPPNVQSDFVRRACGFYNRQWGWILRENFPLLEATRQAHKQACKNKEGFYIDPKTGLKVATEYYLLKRGFCCSSGCRHCPYEYLD